jgi:hypothetical protein
MSALLDSALAYAKRGLRVFPCRPRDKWPACAHGFHDATIDPNVIAGWWRGNPECNIGIATGEQSGIFVVDLDDADAESELRKLEQQNSALPPTVESITGKGRHLFFAWPNRSIRNSVGAKGGIAPGIDIRGQGGYVIAPPSIHPSGRAYAWSVDSARAFADAPPWLIERIAARPRGATPPTQWRELVKGIPEGARNCQLTSLAGLLLRRRIDAVVTLALLQGFNARYCSPPLPESDVHRIVDSICGREFQRRNEHG